MCVCVCVREREKKKDTRNFCLFVVVYFYFFFALFSLSCRPTSSRSKTPSIFRFFVSNETVNKDTSKQNLLEIFKKSIL